MSRTHTVRRMAVRSFMVGIPATLLALMFSMFLRFRNSVAIACTLILAVVLLAAIYATRVYVDEWELAGRKECERQARHLTRHLSSSSSSIEPPFPLRRRTNIHMKPPPTDLSNHIPHDINGSGARTPSPSQNKRDVCIDVFDKANSTSPSPSFSHTTAGDQPHDTRGGFGPSPHHIRQQRAPKRRSLAQSLSKALWLTQQPDP